MELIVYGTHEMRNVSHKGCFGKGVYQTEKLPVFRGEMSVCLQKIIGAEVTS